MLKNTVLAAALSAAFAAPLCAPSTAFAADSDALAEIREQIRQMKQSYETRMQGLEQRLQEAEQKNQTLRAQLASAPGAANPAAAASAAAGGSAPAGVGQTNRAAPANRVVNTANAFNPALSLTLGGTASNLSQDPNQYRLQGFMPAGEGGPGSRGFNLGESELTLEASVDHLFRGRLTVALSPENEAEVEEAYVQTLGLGNGMNLKAGRFLSGLGYLNSHHAHTWDFVDAPLAYQAFFGGQLKQDGMQWTWLAPTSRYLEFGLELGRGDAFPGTGRNKNGFGSAALTAHTGDDIGDSSSWRLGLSHLRTRAEERGFEDDGLAHSFNGKSSTWVADAIYKWAPGGNATQRNLKLQAEYFRRTEDGSLTRDTAGTPASGAFASRQSGWYAQGVYQFMPKWRAGLRYDRLSSGRLNFGTVDGPSASDFPSLASFSPRRTSLMVDWSPSEFSRWRLQLARDKARPDGGDTQIFLQYVMNLGAHGGHAF